MGVAADRPGVARRRAQVRDHRHRLRLPEVHAGAVPRGRPLERLSGGDERAVRARQEDAARAVAGVPRSSTASTRSSCCRSTSTVRATTSIRARRTSFPALIRKCVEAGSRALDRIEVWGDGTRDARVPLRRGRRGRHPAGERALRRQRAGEPRLGRGDLDRRRRPRAWPTSRASAGASSGTRRNRTGSRAGAWTFAAPGNISGFARAHRSTRGCAARSTGTCQRAPASPPWRAAWTNPGAHLCWVS